MSADFEVLDEEGFTDYDPSGDFDDAIPTISAPAPAAAAAAAAEVVPAEDTVGNAVAVQVRATELATQYAVLGAIGAGITAIQNRISGDMTALYAEAGLAKGTLKTPFGSVAMRENKGKSEAKVADEDALITWLTETLPEAVETITRVKPDFMKMLLADRFAIKDGKVIDAETGAVLGFMEVKVTESRPPTASYSSTKEQNEAKIAATVWVDQKISDFAGALDPDARLALTGTATS